MVRTRAGAIALRAKRRGIYRETTWPQMLAEVTRIALGLHALGVRKGDRVAIVGDPSPEWLYCDFAAQCLGAISYGLYPTSSPEEIAYTLRHGGASVLIAEDQEHVDKVLPLLEQLPDLRRIVVIDDSNVFQLQHHALMSLADLIKLADSQRQETFSDLCNAVRPDDPVTIVYTSGSSAHPKGAVYTHHALIAQGHQFFAFPELVDSSDIRSVVHLPLNHLYERMNTPMGMRVKGIVPHFGEEVGRFIETLTTTAPSTTRQVRATGRSSLPRVIVGIENSTWTKRASYRLAMRFGSATAAACGVASAPSSRALYQAARIAVFDRMLRNSACIWHCLPSRRCPLPAEVQSLASLGRQPQEHTGRPKAA